MQDHNTIFSIKELRKKIQNKYTNKISNKDTKIKIIENWQNNLSTGKYLNAKEEEISSIFLTQFFGKVLGYEYDNPTSWNLRLENKTKIDSTKSDAALGYFKIEAQNELPKDVRVVIEIKNARTSLDKPQNRKSFKGSPVEQAFMYASKLGEDCKWLIVSNFLEIRLYLANDMTKYESFDIMALTDNYEFLRFHYLLAFGQLFLEKTHSSIDILLKNRIEKEKTISQEFYEHYRYLRELFFYHLKTHNPKIPALELLEYAQTIIDRIIFISVVKDYELVPYNVLKDIEDIADKSWESNKQELWTQIKKFFVALNKGLPPRIHKFNGGLFKQNKNIDELIIKDVFLKRLLSINNYDFESDLDVNILGHIFEQSISDIEQLKKEIIEGEQFEYHETDDEIDFKKTKIKTNKRKKEGIYYTPEDITFYIVKSTIGAWLNEHKTKIGINNITTLPKNEKEKKKQLELWKQYKKVLKNIKILDPACGSGAFLTQAFNYLLNEWKLIFDVIEKLTSKKIDKQNNGIFNNSLTKKQELLSKIKKDIVTNNIYGVDLNNESVEITKLGLWLKSASRKDPLALLDENIKCGNSLISDKKITDKAFCWDKEFKEIMNNGGFDVIIGNPPWGAELSENEKKHLKTRFDNIDTSTPNTFSYFLGLFYELGKQIGVIVPDSFLIKDFEKTRKLYKNGIKKLFWYQNSSMPDSERPFPEVEHDVVTIIFDKFATYNNLEYSLQKYENSEFTIKNFNRLKSDICDENYFNIFNLLIDDIAINLKNKLRCLQTVSSQTQIHEGIHSGNCRKILFKQNKTKGDEKPLFIGGRNGDIIDNYYSQMAGWYVDYNKALIDKSKGYYASLRDENIFKLPKVYITRTGKPFKSFIDIDNYASNNFFSLQMQDYEINTIENLSFFVCLFNSNFTQYYIRKIIAPRIGETFVETKIIHLLKTPIPKNFSNNSTNFKDFVNQIVKQKKNLQTEKNNFLKTLQEEKQFEKLSKNLKNFHEIKYDEFKNELREKKIKINLGAENNDWREYFNTTKEKILSIEKKIKILDNEINQIIYKLYKLTDQEIEIIEKF